MKKTIILSIIILLLFLGSSRNQAYTTSTGVEKNDVVNVDYVLTVNGVIEDEGTGFETLVSPSKVIQGFYEGLLGMTLGQDKKIIVPPEKGYSSGKLAGKTLIFQVTLNFIVKNVRGTDYVENSTPAITSSTNEDTQSNKEVGSVLDSIFGSVVFQGGIAISLIMIIYIKSTGTKAVADVAKEPQDIYARLKKREEMRRQSKK